MILKFRLEANGNTGTIALKFSFIPSKSFLTSVNSISEIFLTLSIVRSMKHM